MDYTCIFLDYLLETRPNTIILKNSKNKPRFNLELDSKVQALEISKEKKIKEYIIDETVIKAGSSELIWLWVAIEPTNKEILSFQFKRTKICL